MSFPKPDKTGVVYLSHPLAVDQPAYGGKAETLEIFSTKSIRNGDSCHTFRVTFDNHVGTHVDAPAHFFENASTILDYPADFWIFNHPQVLSFPVRPAQLLEAGLFERDIKSTTDFLILKTGFQSFRSKAEYGCHNPGISAAAGLRLRERFPAIQAIGFDFISLSSYQNRAEGRLAHKAFLDPKGKGHPILIVEDMDLDKDLTGLSCVAVVPLLVQGIDSAPCTVMGFL
jgi:arylformamidase